MSLLIGCGARTVYARGMSANPYVPVPDHGAEEVPDHESQEDVLPGPWSRSGSFPDVPDLGGLETVSVRGGGCWLVGAHGGAGTTTVSDLLGWAESGCVWPVSADEQVLTVWVVARTHARGVRAAQDAAVQWAGAGLPGVELGGVVWMPDSPRKPSRAMRELKAHVSGAFPMSVTVPWVEAWREDEASASSVPLKVRRAVRPLTTARKEQQIDRRSDDPD